MSSSVMNGAIGKSPLINKVNLLTEREVKDKTASQMAQQICGGKSVKYPSVPVSFPECKKEIKEQITRHRKERQDRNVNV